MKIDLNKFARFDSNGRVSLTETLFALEGVVANFADNHNELVDRIESAVNSVFEQNPDNSVLPMTAVVSKAVEILNPAMSDIASTQKQVIDFIHKSAKFETRKGPTGGCRRVS